MHLSKSLAFAGLVAFSSLALAHGDAEHQTTRQVRFEQKPWGIAGSAKAVRRTIEIVMTDDMRFTPNRIDVRQGETVRFIHRNNGAAMHEFVLGTKDELDAHAALMKKFPGMEHDEPYMAHVAPAKQGEIVWTFNRSGEFDFACLLPGHYEAGMVGKIRVLAANARNKGK